MFRKRFPYSLVIAVAVIVGCVSFMQPPPAPKIEPLSLAASEVMTPITYNLSLANADTQYSQALPAGCRYVTIQARTAAAVRWSFETGKVAAPTSPYNTLKAGSSYSTPEKFQAEAAVIYAASSSAGTVLEIVAYF